MAGVMLPLLTAAMLVMGAGREHVVDCRPLTACGDPTAYGDTFEWQRRTPLDLLEKLQGLVAKQGSGPVGVGYTVHGYHRGWVRESDVPQLLKLVDSTLPSAAVISSLSSVLPAKSSTVGREAMFLIEGYRSGVYPPAITSAHCKCDPDEVRRWWKERADGRSGT